MKCLIAVVLLVLCSKGYSDEKTLYQSESFSIDAKSVQQGDFLAVTESDTCLQSNYVSQYKKPTKKVMDFKFSINGDDNERYPGENHHLLLDTQNGQLVSPVYTFGAPDPEKALIKGDQSTGFFEDDVNVTILVNMNPVLESFKRIGFYTLFNGEKINADDFKGLFIAGSTLPLSWDFANLSEHSEFKLADPDGDGIYEITLIIKQFQQAVQNTNSNKWKPSLDTSKYPQYHSDYPISDVLYNLSLEELILDLREDGAFMAGAKWPGVWTRDISYSILLSLAIIEPEAARKSLMHKVKNQRIIQDTGTGGSWPVSTDRMTWALAAWEIYTVTGDTNWLLEAFEIIKNSAEDDLLTIINPNTGLVSGESSFLDWREQSYPRWMDPKDIYNSQCLGTNAVHYRTYEILSEMALTLNQPEITIKYKKTATSIKQAINENLWLEKKGFYGQYLYGGKYYSLSPRSETLGEALCILFNIADKNQKQSIITNTPTSSFGIPCFSPQIPNIPSYHNNAIWPFVEAYWAWAATKTGNSVSVEHSLASIYRSAALYLSNKENMVAETGDYMGTEINSDRQLWSVAGNLAIIYRIFFGMEFQSDGLYFQP
ncbi:MAG: glycogen debranching protein, partial [Planctomycetia bacterium]|nr:glycogen debranching protein [Planctomycetia bacterium]